jgi:transposase
MHYKEPKSRNELLLYPNIDLWVDRDNPVHLIDPFIEKFVKENPTICSWEGHSDKGCTSYSPSTMLKLLLNCYFNWIPGSRRTENETYRSIEQTLEKYLDNVEETDELEDKLEQESNDKDDLKKKIRKLEDEKDIYRQQIHMQT